MKKLGKYSFSVLTVILTFIIPLGLCLFFPFENLFAPVYNPLILCLSMFGFTAVFSAICIGVWNNLVKKYESTGT